MRVEPTNDLPDSGFVITQTRATYHCSYFSFFVDHDSACWSRFLYNARVYKTHKEAEEVVAEIKARRRIQARERKLK